MASEMASEASFSYKTYDIVIMALLAAISAVAYVALAQVWLALTAALGPLGGMLLGFFQFGHLIAFAILRKPGVALITSILTTVGQLLLGDSTGVWVLGWGILHGLGAEVVFLATRYRKPSLLTLCLAGGVAAVIGHFYTYWMFGWQDATWMFFVSIPILFLSSAFESGWLAHYVTQALAKTGVLAKAGQ